MKSIIKTAIFACWALQLIGAAAAQTTEPSIRFGRYELTEGQSNDLCLAVGKQVATYKRVPFEPGPFEKSIPGVDPAFQNAHDFRCDFPLKDADGIKTMKWTDFDIFDEAGNNLYEFYAAVGAVFKTALDSSPDEIPFNRRWLLTSGAQAPLAVMLAANGILKMQQTTLEIDSVGKVVASRLNQSTSTKGQQCWGIAFPLHSPLFKMVRLNQAINTLFQYEGHYYFMKFGTYQGDGVSVVDLEHFLQVPEEQVGRGTHFAGAGRCIFELRKGQGGMQ